MTMAAAPRPGAGEYRLLYVADRVLTPEIDGASARKRAILEALQRLGCRITFVAHHPDSFYAYAETRERDVAALEAMGIEVARPPAVASVEALLAARGDELDLVVMSPYPIAHRYLPAVRRHAPGAVAVYNAIDLGHLQHYRRARATGNVPDLTRALEAKAQETELARGADAVLVCSEEERTVLGALSPGASILVAGHVVRARPAPTPFATRSGMLFLGSFPHPANVDAMRHFVADVLPAVRAAVPGITLTIAGLDPAGELAPLAGDGVAAIGWVKDLDEVFARARVFVAPLRYGAGIKIKLLESLSRGLPVVASPVAAEGLHLVDGESALIAAGVDELAAAVVRLHGDHDLWRRLAAGGLAVIERHFSAAAMEAPLAALLRRVRRREADDAAR
jgi:O-antigen biosynthesis protein